MIAIKSRCAQVKELRKRKENAARKADLTLKSD